HDGVNFPGLDLQVDAFEDFFALNGCVQVFDAQHLSRLSVFGNSVVNKLTNGTFKADFQKLAGFDRKLHGQLFEHFLTEAVHNHGNRLLRVDAALTAQEHLLVADLGGGGFVFHDGRFVLAFDVREGVGATAVADQQRVALGKVARTFRTRAEFHQPAVGVGAPSCRDALGNDGALGVFAKVDHLGAGVGLLEVMGQRDGVEFAHAVFTTQHAARVLPGNG